MSSETDTLNGRDQPHRGAPLRKGATEALLRLISLGASLSLVWVAEERIEAYTREVNVAGGVSVVNWFLYVGAGVLAGVFLGLAISPPLRRADGYRWGLTAVLSFPPALLLASEIAFLRLRWIPPGWVLDLVYRGRIAIALILGGAIMAGFASRRPSLKEKLDGP